MSKCEEGISLVELVHEQHEEIVILKAERDRYRKENTHLYGECQRIILQRDGLADTVKRYRKALEAIMKKLVYDNEDEVRMWIKDIPCDVQMDYMEAYQIAKHALEGDKE